MENTKEFEPYETHKPSADTLAVDINRWAELMGLERPIDGDALARDAAEELKAKLQGIVVTEWVRTVLISAPNLIPTSHAARLIGVSVARLHQMIHEGKATPEARAECCGSYMFHPEEIDRIQKERNK